jgi:hypothetical protein
MSLSVTNNLGLGSVGLWQMMIAQTTLGTAT